jgi:hypothetical protein
MATSMPAIGSDRARRSDPIPHIGPLFEPAWGDPVAAMPVALPALAAPMLRIEGVRLMQGRAHWRAVGLRLKGHDPEGTLFEVFLSAGDGRDVVIASVDEEDAVALWRGAGAAMLLPLVMQTPDGAVSCPYPQLGAVALGDRHYRRQHAFLRTRRPRFLTRRKPGRPLSRAPSLTAEG